MMMKLVMKPLRWLARLLLALLILFEEWGWEPLRRAMARLAARLPLRWLERRLTRLPPHAALLVLVLPSLLIIPIKLLALWLIAEGKAMLGVAVIVAAKLAGTALLAWLFQLIQPALLRLAWFARLYARWSGWKAELLAWVRGSAAWRAARAMRQRLRRAWRRQRKEI
ncbi:hypothetical protein [Roseateles sp. DAIF2]|uniref:hypothetical protein n=1 Tax=Roseateles sp. DAIF2 TaxID=2714952 RepID=UPI0035303BB2